MVLNNRVMVNTEKAIKFLNDNEVFKNGYPALGLKEYVATQMQKYLEQELSIIKNRNK
jgi:hypothetical protein